MSDQIPTATPTKLVKLSSLKANRDVEREGDWQPAADIPGVSFFVRSTNYAAYKIERDARFAKLARKFGADAIPDDERAKVLGELAVKHLLLDWKGLDEPFSPEKAEEVLTDEAYRDFRGTVYLCAMKVGQGEVEFVEGTAKN
jgi:hypothetical protein